MWGGKCVCCCDNKCDINPVIYYWVYGSVTLPVCLQYECMTQLMTFINTLHTLAKYFLMNTILIPSRVTSPICSRCLILHAIDSTRGWKHSLMIGPCRHNCITQFLQIVLGASLSLCHVSNVFNWIPIGWLGRSLKNTELIVSLLKPVCDDFCSVTFLYWKVTIRKWVYCGPEAMHVIGSESQIGYSID